MTLHRDNPQTSHFYCKSQLLPPGSQNTKFTTLIFVVVVELAAGISFFATRGYSQTAPSYQQTASVDGGSITGSESTTGLFPLAGNFTSAQTDIELLPAIVNGVQTTNGTSMSEAETTSTTTSLGATASTKALYLVEVNGPASQSVELDIVGTLLGSVGTAQGEAFALVGFAEAPVARFDIFTGSQDDPLNYQVTVTTNSPQVMELVTSATLSGGFGIVSSQIDPYVQIDPSVPDPQQYQLTFLTTPVPEPSSWTMLVEGLGFLLAVLRCRRFLVV